MRRWIVPALVAVLALAGCGAGSKSDGSASVRSEIPKVVVTSPSLFPSAAPTTDTKLVDAANPCMLVRPGDLNKVFTVDGKQPAFSSVNGEEPPVVGTFHKRNCGYTGIVPGTYTDQPVDGTEVTIMVTTQVDDADSTAFNALLEVGENSGKYQPVPEVAHGAFFMEEGHLIAHKGRVIIEVNPFIDTDNVVTNSVAEYLVKKALSRVAG